MGTLLTCDGRRYKMEKINTHLASDIVTDRYKYHKTNKDKYFWAVSLWWDLESWEDRQEYLIAILSAAPIEDLDYLGGIGAGPLEDLRDIHILEFISDLRKKGIPRDSDFDKKLCIALQMFRLGPCGEPLTEAEQEIIKYIKYHYPSFVNDGMYHTC
jgi:hypothetical protein